jgi:hypothetical protein
MKGENSKTFTKLSQEVAEKFLHTIVFVDDQGFIERARPKKLEKPGRVGGQGKDAQESSNERNTHELDAKKVIDMFASRGMVCSVLKPDKEDELLGLATKAAERADVLILDWKIYNDDGDKAMGIIRNIISSDSTDDQRLRLIIIYTAENIVWVSKKMEKKLEEKYSGNFEVDGEGFAFSRGHLRIAIFAKEGADVPPDIGGRVLSIAKLSEQVSVEFAKITAGLVSNVALESLAVLRDNTHRIMGRLGPEMDPAYLSHRALLPYPDDAKDHVVDIIASEFSSILESYNVGNQANIKAIKKWLKYNNLSKDFMLYNSDSTGIEINCDEILKFLQEGFDTTRKAINRSKTNGEMKISANSFKNFTKTFCFNETVSSNDIDCKFSMLTSLKNRYNGVSNPILTLGTILKENLEEESTEDSHKYWLCIMPRCDCVRIGDGKRNFFFLHLEEGTDNGEFNIVVLGEDDNFVKLKINNKIFNSRFAHFEFTATNSNQVQSEEKEGNLVFYTTDKSKCFKWVSELKKEHAQRIVNNLASEISRVGLDESEWLRRSAK